MYDPLAGAERDILTGFYRRESLEFFSKVVAMDIKSVKKKYGVSIIDLDHFKHFNDKYGHQFGDEILKHAASILRNTILDNGYIFRYGGDEFVIILPDFTAKEAFQLIQSCNRNIVVNPFMHKGKAFFLSFSCGVAEFPTAGATIELVLKKADDALYYSKRKGRNRVTLFSNIKYPKLLNLLKIFFSLLILGLTVFFIRTYLPKELLSTIGIQIKEAVSMIDFANRSTRENKLQIKEQFDFVQPKPDPIVSIPIVSTVKAPEQSITQTSKIVDSVVPVKSNVKTYAEISMKRGGVVIGTIIEETSDKVVVRLDLSDGKGSISLRKPDIQTINFVTYSSDSH